MNDAPDTPSGSRREPTTPARPDASPDEPTAPIQAQGTAGGAPYPVAPAEPVEPVGAQPSSRLAWSLPLRPARTTLGVVAAGLVLLSGVGGFAVGRASAPEGDRLGLVSDTTGQPGGRFHGPGDGDHGEDGFPVPPDQRGAVPDGSGEDSGSTEGGATT